MSVAAVQTESHSKLITCILPKGAGKPLLEALHNYGVTTANLFFSRGADVGDPLEKGGMPVQVQKEIVTAVVQKKDADQMFEFMIEHGQIDRPGGGLVYIGELQKSVPFVLPAIPDPSHRKMADESGLDIPTESNSRLITCILPKGSGKPLLEALHQHGVTTASLNFARGANVGDPAGKDGLPVQEEKEIVTVIVSKKEVDDIFEFVVETARIDQPGGGFVYMGELRKSVPFVLPESTSPPKEA